MAMARAPLKIQSADGRTKTLKIYDGLFISVRTYQMEQDGRFKKK